MHRIFIVATSEFLTLVRTKAFLIGVFMMPVFVGGSIALQKITMERPDTERRSFAVIDMTGVLYEPLARAAEVWNRVATSPAGTPVAGTFDPSRVDLAGRPAEVVRLELSDRVRRGEIFAFVEIPASVLDPQVDAPIRYYSNHPAHEALPRFLEEMLAREIVNRRFEAASLDRAMVDQLTRTPPVDSLGLVERSGTGITQAAGVDKLRTFAIPGAFMLAMFLLVMTSSPQLLNSVIEEKMSRISEVLVASVTPFQLMMGKLLGSVAVSLLLGFIYLSGGYALAAYWGYGGVLTPGLVIAFLFYLVLAVLLFGSMFIAIGAACTDLKDAQNMMTPAMVLVMFPLFMWVAVLRAPDSGLALAISLFPPSTPFIMLLRIALQPPPPLWQILLSALLVGVTVVLAVWAAGRIFRAGLLLHGKAATPREMLRWITTG
jgi:ABC-2 type transport system permease protein